MNLKKRVSIALATYNGAEYLAPYLDSLLNQSRLPDEIIVVDDCSKDNTVDVLNSYSNRLPIKIIVNDHNLGVNKNFEKAVSCCSGDYILLSDQDDVWLPQNIERKIAALDKLPSELPAFVGSFSTLVDQNLKVVQKFYPRQTNNDFIECLLTPYQGTTVAINKKMAELLPEWPADFKTFAYDVFLRFFAVFTGNVLNLQESLMLYRNHANNVFLSANKLSLFLKKIPIVRTLILNRQYAVSKKRIRLIKEVYSNIDIKQRNIHNCEILEKFFNCFNADKLSIWRFLRVREISRKIKIRVMLAQFFAK